jgi:putative ABC transport system permease protein
MDALLRDLRYAIRGLRRTPAFTLSAVLALALGIGATTAIFSVVHAALLRPLGWSDEGRLVAVRANFPGHALYDMGPSLPEYSDVRAMPFVENAGTYLSGNAALQGSDAAERVQVANASSTFFQTLGAQPLYGRIFTASEDLQGNDGVALISEQAFRRRFGGDPAAVGKSVTIDGTPRIIVGVLPGSFRYGQPEELYVPFGFTPDQLTARRSNHGFDVVARLKPGISLEQAGAQIATLSDAIRAAHPEAYSREAGWRFSLAPLRQELLGKTREPLLLLFGAVVLVLLIACGNVANLLLARSAARERELAVRAALGARRSRIVRQLLTESLLLALAGAALGVAAARFGLDALLVAAPESIRGADVSVDRTVLAFAAAAAMGTALIFGLLPALRASRADLVQPLKGTQHHKLGAALVAAQVALSIVLLAGAGLLLRSFSQVLQTPTGFESSGVLAATVSLGGPAYDTHADARILYYQRALRAVAALPGVESAGAIDVLPTTGTSDRSYEIESYQPRPGEPKPESQFHATTAGYFEALRIPLLQGRNFAATDDAHAAQVVLVNQAWVRRYLPGREVLGQRLRLTVGTSRDAPEQWRTIVGVAGDVRELGIDKPAPPAFFVPIEQLSPGQLDVVVRAPPALAQRVRETLAHTDASQPVDRIQPLGELTDAALAQRRFPLRLLGAFAVLALLLSALGIYGVTSYSVAQRTREIALRMAVGATEQRVLRMVLGAALRTAALGAVAGVLGALLLTRVLSSMLYGVSATDPVTYLVTVALFGFVALTASALPARRASRTNPMTALRAE